MVSDFPLRPQESWAYQGGETDHNGEGIPAGNLLPQCI